MQHTPYGYDIIGGKAVVNEEQASNIHKIFENYLGGMFFISAAADVGLTMSHCGVKRMIQNKTLLGDSFSPVILTAETARQIEEERIRREKSLGRDQRGHKKVEKVKVHTAFSMPRVPRKYDNPIRQAEFAYSLIKSEMSG